MLIVQVFTEKYVVQRETSRCLLNTLKPRAMEVIMMTSSMIDQSFAGVIDTCRNALSSVEMCGDGDARSIGSERLRLSLAHEILHICSLSGGRFPRGKRKCLSN